MKPCVNNCGFNGNPEDFPLAGSKGKRSNMCRQCKNKYDRDYYHSKTDKEEKKRANIDRYKITKTKLKEYLQGKSCVDCGNSNIIVLDFDHLENKLGNISNLSHRWSWNRLQTEIAKCEIVCANCHRIRTAERMGGTFRSTPSK